MIQVFRLPSAVPNDPSVDAWFAADENQMRRLARPWFDRMRSCGADVHELLHDGHPTACLGIVAFGYVNAFSAHANVGFFNGAALEALIASAYRHLRSSLEAPS